MLGTLLADQTFALASILEIFEMLGSFIQLSAIHTQSLKTRRISILQQFGNQFLLNKLKL
jgi:hypothetical protein